MRLLFLAPSPPSPCRGGGSLRMYHIVRYLGERYDLDLVAPALEGVEEAENLVGKVCSDMEFVTPSSGGVLRRVIRVSPYVKDPALAYAVRRRLDTRAYSAVQVEKPAMLTYLPKSLRSFSSLEIWGSYPMWTLRCSWPAESFQKFDESTPMRNCVLWDATRTRASEIYPDHAQA